MKIVQQSTPVIKAEAALLSFKFEIIDMDGHRIDKVLVTASQEILDEMDE